MTQCFKVLAFSCLAGLGLGTQSLSQTMAQEISTPSSPPLASQLQATPNPVLLAPGTQNSDVRTLQEHLKNTGHYSGDVDGVYGVDTQQAIQAFQQQQHLPVTGQLDQRTWEQMQQDSTRRQPAIAPAADASLGVPSLEETAPLPSSAEAAKPTVLEATSSTPPPSNPSPALAISAAETADQPSSLPEQPNTSPTNTASTATEGMPPEVSPPLPDETSREFRWPALLLGVGVLTIGFGVGFTLWRKRQRPQSRDTTDPLVLSDDPWEDDDFDHNGTSTAIPPSPRVPVAQADQTKTDIVPSSKPDASSHLPPIAGDTEPSSLALTTSESHHLSRINILDELLEDLQSPNPDRRHQAIWELGQRGNSAAMQPLVDTLLEADSRERSLILAALSEIGMRTLTPMNRALTLSLQDQSPEVRKNAIRDLTRLFTLIGQTQQILAHAAHDSHPDVQETAQWAIEQLTHLQQLAMPPPTSIQNATSPRPGRDTVDTSPNKPTSEWSDRLG